SPATCEAYMCFATILPDFMLTSISATMPDCEPAKPPSAIPRPVRMFPVCLTEFATRGVQFAACATAFSESRHCHWPPPVVADEMFCRRNWYGSMPARYARWSITCSQAKHVCIAFGARSVDVLNALLSVGVVLPMIRRFRMSYCVPE